MRDGGGLMGTLGARVSAVVALALVSGAEAITIPGGGKVASDCYLVLEASAVGAFTDATTLDCVDGDPGCDRDGECGNDACTHVVRVCVGAAGLAGCTPPPGLKSVKIRKDALPRPTSLVGSQCGAFSEQIVRVKEGRRGKRPGMLRFAARTRATRARPAIDRDRYVLLCQPRFGECPATTTSTSTTSTTSTSIATTSTTTTSTTITTTSTTITTTTSTESSTTTTSTSTTSTITLAVCGNGAVETGEQCDDGNTTGIDGCGTTCQLEPPNPLNETGTSAEADYCNLQFPATLNATTGQPTSMIFGRLFEAGVTEAAGAPAGVLAQVGYGPASSDPTISTAWRWVTASFTMQVGNDDEFATSVVAPSVPGSFAYTFRFSFDGGQQFTYCDLDGAGSNAGLTFSSAQLGTMTVTP